MYVRRSVDRDYCPSSDHYKYLEYLRRRGLFRVPTHKYYTVKSRAECLVFLVFNLYIDFWKVVIIWPSIYLNAFNIFHFWKAICFSIFYSVLFMLNLQNFKRKVSSFEIIFLVYKCLIFPLFKRNKTPFIIAYRTDDGKPWVLPVVRRTEQAMAANEVMNHEYLPVLGLDSFSSAATRMLLGKDNKAIAEGRVSNSRYRFYV